MLIGEATQNIIQITTKKTKDFIYKDYLFKSKQNIMQQHRNGVNQKTKLKTLLTIYSF